MHSAKDPIRRHSACSAPRGRAGDPAVGVGGQRTEPFHWLPGCCGGGARVTRCGALVPEGCSALKGCVEEARRGGPGVPPRQAMQRPRGWRGVAGRRRTGPAHRQGEMAGPLAASGGRGPEERTRDPAELEGWGGSALEGVPDRAWTWCGRRGFGQWAGLGPGPHLFSCPEWAGTVALSRG